jgi:hypothetical protein
VRGARSWRTLLAPVEERNDMRAADSDPAHYLQGKGSSDETLGGIGSVAQLRTFYKHDRWSRDTLLGYQELQ